MPMYAFRNGDDVIERAFPVKDRPKFVIVDGKRYDRSIGDECPGIPSSKGWPFECVASGVHPSQADELREHFRKSGVPTEVTKDGNPIYRDAAHRRKALKCRGMHDRASYL